ncbi:MAG: hypothetical protein R3F54_02555 [Alphaproteobacteria bacterium]
MAPAEISQAFRRSTSPGSELRLHVRRRKPVRLADGVHVADHRHTEAPAVGPKNSHPRPASPSGRTEKKS